MPTMKELREAGVASALAPIAARLNTLKQGVRESQEVESLTMKIAAVTEPHRFKLVIAEVERRAQVFADAQVSTVRVMGSPRLRALQSVLDDLVTGRFA